VYSFKVKKKQTKQSPHPFKQERDIGNTYPGSKFQKPINSVGLENFYGWTNTSLCSYCAGKIIFRKELAAVLLLGCS